MLEIQLLMLFIISFAVIFINGIIIRNFYVSKSRYVMLLTIDNDTEDIELIVRKFVYRLADEYPEAIVILINFNADKEKIQIFEKLMKYSCKYIIINYEKSSENVCNIIESVLY